MIRHPTDSPTSTLNDVADDNLTFASDSERYDEIPTTLPEVHTDSNGRPKLTRSNTMTGTKKSMASSKWGYGWGVGKKQKEKEAEADKEQESMGSQTNLPLYQPPTSPPTRSNTQSTQASKSSMRTHHSQKSQQSVRIQESPRSHSPGPRDSLKRNDSQRSHVSQKSYSSQASRSTERSAASTQRSATLGQPSLASGSLRRPQLYPSDSTSTLVGSALERKMAEVDSIRDYGDTGEKLADLRRNMSTHHLDYYIVPGEDAHGSDCVAESDQRRQFISGFYGSAGQAIITMTSAYLFTDSRYWLQAREQLDKNWTLVKAGGVGEPKDWIEWLMDRVKDARIGLDARMISHEKAMLINDKILQANSKLVYPPQNLVDLVWKDKPQKSRAPIFLHPIEFAGVSATTKLHKLREWIKSQPPSVPSYSKGPATPDQVQVGTLITSLSCIAYLLNLRGSDIPHNPLFHAYLYVGLEGATLFIDGAKVVGSTGDYLKTLGVERREYLDLWTFLRRREWGTGKVLISPQTSYAISLMLTHYRYTVAPSWIEHTMAVKNETELDGLRRAYQRDGAAFVRFLAWLENKLNDGYDITEYEAASRLTEFRRSGKHFMGLAYKSISATGSNAALPHYTPRKSTARMIERDTPYLK
ncbi:hypothetical protein H0H81_001226 [Sphagnurus paluster]|uniref:Uncharacterized protein n=1 Tax=Sphagnurus paluster TaxID=117069 RepID=A0A9P7FVW9_9AGAR|nr:hypothetical protein H0H81_001226 [Sphagnurus paluster]